MPQNFVGNTSLERYEKLLIYGMFRLLPSTSLSFFGRFLDAFCVIPPVFDAPNLVFCFDSRETP